MLEKQEALSMLRTIVSASRGGSGCHVLEDLLPDPIQNNEALDTLCVKIQEDDEFKKKIVCVYIYTL